MASRTSQSRFLKHADESYHPMGNLAKVTDGTDNGSMKSLFVAGLLAMGVWQSEAQNIGVIPENAKIYVDAATGFDTYLAAAIKSQHVPLAITTEKNAADYELEALSGARRIPSSSWSVLWGHGDAQAVIRLIDIRTSEIVFVYALETSKLLHDERITAEACARQLKFGMNPAVNPSRERVKSKDPALNF
jgi:hypothetical protein